MGRKRHPRYTRPVVEAHRPSRDVQDLESRARSSLRTARRVPRLGAIFADGGYQGPRLSRDRRHDRLLEAGKLSAPTRTASPCRFWCWIVERTFAWITATERLGATSSDMPEPLSPSSVCHDPHHAQAAANPLSMNRKAWTGSNWSAWPGKAGSRHPRPRIWRVWSGKRKGKKLSNTDWVSKSDPEAQDRQDEGRHDRIWPTSPSTRWIWTPARWWRPSCTRPMRATPRRFPRPWRRPRQTGSGRWMRHRRRRTRPNASPTKVITHDGRS